MRVNARGAPFTLCPHSPSSSCRTPSPACRIVDAEHPRWEVPASLFAASSLLRQLLSAGAAGMAGAQVSQGPAALGVQRLDDPFSLVVSRNATQSLGGASGGGQATLLNTTDTRLIFKVGLSVLCRHPTPIQGVAGCPHQPAPAPAAHFPPLIFDPAPLPIPPTPPYPYLTRTPQDQYLELSTWLAPGASLFGGGSANRGTVLVRGPGAVLGGARARPGGTRACPSHCRLQGAAPHPHSVPPACPRRRSHAMVTRSPPGTATSALRPPPPSTPTPPTPCCSRWMAVSAAAAWKGGGLGRSAARGSACQGAAGPDMPRGLGLPTNQPDALPCDPELQARPMAISCSTGVQRVVLCSACPLLAAHSAVQCPTTAFSPAARPSALPACLQRRPGSGCNARPLKLAHDWRRDRPLCAGGPHPSGCHAPGGASWRC